MSGLIAVRQSGPIGARKVETILLSQGAAFDLSGDIALNSAHRQGDGSDHADVAANTLKLSGIEAGAEVNNISDPDATGLTDGGETILHSHPAAAGGIDYSNPISANIDQTITPNNGDYFTTTGELVTLTGSAGEVFEPAKSGETSRIIWGGNAVTAIALTIDTSSLGIGDIFAIEADNGESRVLMLNSVGDLVKIYGVEIPMSFSYISAGDQRVNSGVKVKVIFATKQYDKGNVFSSSTFISKRRGLWGFKSTQQYTRISAPALTVIGGEFAKNTLSGLRHSAELLLLAAAALMTNKGVVGAADFETIANDTVEFYGVAFTSDASDYNIQAVSSGSILTFMSGKEVVEW